MKKRQKSTLIIGPKVRYYRQSVGILRARKVPKPSMIIKGMASFVVVGLAGFSIYGYISQPPAQRTDAVEVSIKPKESAQDSSKLLQSSTEAKEDEHLSSFIKTQLKDLPKEQKWSVYVRDLKSNRMASINADTQMHSASLYKLFVLPPLENKLPIKSWNSRMGASTVNNCILIMVKDSDNACGEAIGTYLGWQYIDKYNKEQGFSRTQLAGSTPKTTARDTGELIYRLQNSQTLSDKARRLFFDAFYAQKHRQGIPAGCGQDCLVGNKHGEIDSFKHDAAVVTHDSSQYVVVIMSQNAGWNDVAKVAGIVDQAMLP